MSIRYASSGLNRRKLRATSCPMQANVAATSRKMTETLRPLGEQRQPARAVQEVGYA